MKLKYLKHLNISFLSLDELPLEILNSKIEIIDITNTIFKNTDNLNKLKKMRITIIC